MSFRAHGTVENQLSMNCSANALVNILQALTLLLPEAVGKTEVIPLGQVISCNVVCRKTLILRHFNVDKEFSF